MEINQYGADSPYFAIDILTNENTELKQKLLDKEKILNDVLAAIGEAILYAFSEKFILEHSKEFNVQTKVDAFRLGHEATVEKLSNKVIEILGGPEPSTEALETVQNSSS